MRTTDTALGFGVRLQQDNARLGGRRFHSDPKCPEKLVLLEDDYGNHRFLRPAR